MAPTDPHHDQSPTQSTRFVSYSPTSKPQAYPPPPYQPPPRTPPAFAAAPVPQSPHYGVHGTASSPSLMNGSVANPSDQSQAYPVAYTPPQLSNALSYGESSILNGHHSYSSNSGSHAHPAKTLSDLSPLSPSHRFNSANTHGTEMANPAETNRGAHPQQQPAEPQPARTSNPMSFASILSDPAESQPPAEANLSASTPIETEKVASALSGVQVNGQDHDTRPVHLSPTHQPAPALLSNGHSLPIEPVEAPAKPNFKPRKYLTAAENERVLQALEMVENQKLSDNDDSVFGAEKERYHEKRQKRALELQDQDDGRRKRRRTHLVDQSLRSFAARNSGASDRFRAKFEPAAQNEVHEKEVREEKERKKDMQRKRRRENTVKQEKKKLAETQERFENTEDAVEKEKLEREVERSRKKIELAEKRESEGGIAGKELSEVGPLAPNYDGGTTSTFPLGMKDSELDKKKTRAGPSTRPKKSKEKKQAQKDAAEAAYAAMERDELVTIAPKQDPRKESLKRGSKSGRVKETTPTRNGANYESKGYQQIFEQIWRDTARKDVPRVHRIKATSLNTRQENHRKTSQLAHKQARKWQERTNKSMKETQARSKRTMREMMSFWKRNEREERDLRRVAERKEIEDAKKAEAEREANRQKRKLNFLISQTELYSHFIGRKIKTDEVERATDDPEIAKAQPSQQAPQDLNIDSSMLDGKKGVTNFEDLDFDEADDAALRHAAVANAQNAVQEAQDKARAFNAGNEEDRPTAFDDNDADLNFQNPSSLGDRQIEQPKMLRATLKEYQLKGLNWLTNLYEQGINGILADEMGLGKTVQSISVMGYLAEQHDIWGPFLVIAPSSTLHNWQQEIDRFVPDIKVLPYWGNAKDRKVLRKCWDRKHVTYAKDAQFHVLVTSYQLVVQDAQYFQKIKWQYMILDEAQAIKSSNSSRWKTLLGFECRNRLLLTGTPIQNNMQELWALLHFIMPTLFDSHDEFSDWFSKDIESHAQSNTRLNHDQLKRLHLILKPFMLRRVKAHVQKELGDKIEEDVYCNLTYRQRAYYGNLRSRISILDLIEKATVGDDQDTATLMNLVMQFRKVCNHPDLFERAEVKSPLSLTHYAETASFLREGREVQLGYSVRNVIEYHLPKMLCSPAGRIHMAGPDNVVAGSRFQVLNHLANIWDPSYLKQSSLRGGAFSFLRFIDTSASEAAHCARAELFDRAVGLKEKINRSTRFSLYEDGDLTESRPSSMFNMVQTHRRAPLAEIPVDSHLGNLMDISRQVYQDQGFATMEAAALPGASAPPIQISCPDQDSINERRLSLFNVSARRALYPIPSQVERAVVDHDVDTSFLPGHDMLPEPDSTTGRFTSITVPSMRRFVTDSGKLAQLDRLLRQLKAGGHRVLLYFQMTKMIDLMEEYLTYCNYKYCRLDGSTKLEDRRDTVHDFQTRPEIFVFLLSTRAGGLGINLTAADTVIFYDSDWNPTIDSQAMDRAHRLGQTRQVTVYRMITRGTIEERIRKRALQKEEVQRVVISGEGGEGVDFNTRTRENRTKDIAMWLADDDQAALIEQKEKEAAERPEEEVKRKKVKKAAAVGGKRKRGEMSLDDMYHEGEGHFEDASAKPSGAATPVSVADPPVPMKGARGGRGSKKAKTKEQRLLLVGGDTEMGGS